MHLKGPPPFVASHTIFASNGFETGRYTSGHFIVCIHSYSNDMHRLSKQRARLRSQSCDQDYRLKRLLGLKPPGLGPGLDPFFFLSFHASSNLLPRKAPAMPPMIPCPALCPPYAPAIPPATPPMRPRSPSAAPSGPALPGGPWPWYCGAYWSRAWVDWEKSC